MAANQLNRAYVQSKVIEANLEHLRDLLGSEALLGNGLRPIARGFGQYVRLLGDACRLADASASVSDTAGTGHLTAA